MKNLNLKKYTKYFVGFLGGVLIVGAGFWYYQYTGPKFELDETGELIPPKKRFGESMLEYQERYVQQAEDYKAYRDEFYKQDIYGGETPEETLQMYIEALENRDFELASKYFVLKDQERELKELNEINWSPDKYIDMLKNAYLSEYNDIFSSYELRVYIDGIDAIIMNILKNEQSGLWKMESL